MIKDFLSSKSYEAYRLRKTFGSFWVSFFGYLIYFAGISSFAYLILARNSNLVNPEIRSLLYIVLGFGIFIFLINIYVKFGTHIQNNLNIQKKTSENLFDYFNEKNIEILGEAIDISRKNNVREINLMAILVALDKTDIGRVFAIRSGFIVDDATRKSLIDEMKSLSANAQDQLDIQNKNFLNQCDKEALASNHTNINFSDLVMSLYKNLQIFSHVLNDIDIKENDLKNILSWTERTLLESKKKYYWQKDYYPAGIGQDWASGYTPYLNMYCTDISQYLIDAKLEYQSQTRQEIIKTIEDDLAKSGRNNILLIGDPGVGKTTLVNSLAQKIGRGKSYPSLNYKHLFQLDINKILAGVNSKSELEARFLAVFNETTYAGNIILFVKEIDHLIGNYLGEMGTVNAAEFLVPYLESGEINVIASISYDSFKGKMQANTSLETLFNKIEVKEMSKEEVIPSIEHLISFIEIKHGIVFKYQAVKTLIELASRYIHDESFPQKAVDLLSEVGINAQKSNEKIVDVDYINDFMSRKIKMPVGKVEEEEKERLLNLENILHKRVIGQREAIDAVADALRRARAGIAGKKRPIGSFLFIGPTGVGKTETARALAEAYYGSEKNMIRFDMSEFQEVNTIDRLIGTKSGREYVPGRLTQGVKNNPYTLILFDEIEKAHPNILNLLLQVLDEGRLTDAAGKTIDFTSTIIICTSNAGSEKIRQYLEGNISANALGKVIVDYLLSQGIFRPEFINRFDKVVCYKPLDIQEIIQIVKLMIKSLHDDLAEKNIRLEISDGAINKLAEEGYDPLFGARPLRRLIQEKVENLVAKEMISGEVKKGETIKIDKNNI